MSLGLGSLPAPSLPPTARSPNARARQRCRRFAHRASTAVPPSLCPTRQYGSAAFARPCPLSSVTPGGSATPVAADPCDFTLVPEPHVARAVEAFAQHGFRVNHTAGNAADASGG